MKNIFLNKIQVDQDEECKTLLNKLQVAINIANTQMSKYPGIPTLIVINIHINE